jgi:hypothetical protein
MYFSKRTRRRWVRWLEKAGVKGDYFIFEVPPQQRQVVIAQNIMRRGPIHLIYPSSRRVVANFDRELIEWMADQRKESSLEQAMHLVARRREIEEALAAGCRIGGIYAGFGR